MSEQFVDLDRNAAKGKVWSVSTVFVIRLNLYQILPKLSQKESFKFKAKYGKDTARGCWGEGVG